jgi:putative addiction module component (TIGR02574 family)
MEREAVEILEKAIRLSKEARAAIAESLLESLDDEVDADAEKEWRAEIRRRLEEIDSKTVSLVSWSEARKTLDAYLKR